MAQEFQIKILADIDDMLLNFDLIKQLSSQLEKDEYHSLLEIMVPLNYKQMGVFKGEKCIAVSGYWINAKLYSGKYIEIDNFVVDSNYRNKNIGKLLLDNLIEEGRKHECKTAMLDAYVENSGAHRFYHREGFFIRGFHYLKTL